MEDASIILVMNLSLFQLKDHEEQFAEFDKKVYWIRITDCVFDQHAGTQGLAESEKMTSDLLSSGVS